MCVERYDIRHHPIINRHAGILCHACRFKQNSKISVHVHILMHPHRLRQNVDDKVTHILSLQSSHPQRARRQNQGELMSYTHITILAPVKGASILSLCPEQPAMLQSSHPWRVVSILYCRRLINGCYNPRTRIGCVDKALDRRDGSVIVSILAPGWGASVAEFLDSWLECVTILAPAQGTSIECMNVSSDKMLQSSHP